MSNPVDPEQEVINQFELEREKYKTSLAKEAERGERMANWMRETWPFFESEVLQKIKDETIVAFENEQFDPTDHSRVVQLQAILRVKNMIKARTEDIIARGRTARAKLVEMQDSTKQKEGS
jgi:hypothetical protein